jgi:AbrB family looped-hinge helix DNA binding protein
MLGIISNSINKKGQITIPKGVRAKLDLKEGDKITFIIKEKQVIIRKAPAEKISEILRKQKPWKANSMKLQKIIRNEW